MRECGGAVLMMGAPPTSLMSDAARVLTSVSTKVDALSGQMAALTSKVEDLTKDVSEIKDAADHLKEEIAALKSSGSFVGPVPKRAPPAPRASSSWEGS